jgi:hypothetical protein
MSPALGITVVTSEVVCARKTSLSPRKKPFWTTNQAFIRPSLKFAIVERGFDIEMN